MKKIILAFFGLVAAFGASGQGRYAGFSLKETVGDNILIGVAVNDRQVSGKDTAAMRLIKQHFNSIVAENCMKSAAIHPQEARYDFSLADEFVKFGEDNAQAVIGHCLVWHSQTPSWFFVDANGNDVVPDVLKKRIKDHIYNVVGRYKGRVKGWDVVNEAILEDGSYRKSKFYEILGEEFIALTFQYAHEADPEAELYYNDYGMDAYGRRDAVVRMVNSLKEKGLRIDAIGMQGHMDMHYPSPVNFEQSILAFAATGCRVMITEWDMSVLPYVTNSANISDTAEYRKELDPYPEALPDSVSRAWNGRMKEFFDLFVKHSDVISRVTVWGLTDGDSWKNDFPVRGRTDYPLLFDRNYEAKPFLQEIFLNNTLKTEVIN